MAELYYSQTQVIIVYSENAFSSLPNAKIFKGKCNGL